MEKHSVARLIGAPPGYVGYEEGGFLTEQVRRKPYTVILFDEVEKAHPDVFNLFLQILDEGRLTDGQGKTVDFKNTVVLMTSNIGSRLIHEAGLSQGKGSNKNGFAEEYEKVQESVLGELRNHFRPEFLNRIDDVILFHSLSLNQIKGIVEVQMNDLRKRLAEKRMTITLTDSAKEALAEKGYDPAFGARPLKRAIQKYIQDPLSIEILEESLCDGDAIEVDWKSEDEGFLISKVGIIQ